MSTAEFLIEKANPKDFKTLTNIALVSKAALGYGPEIIKLWESELSVSAEMINDYISYVAKIEGEIVGFWCRQPVNGLSDGRLFVLPDQQRKGCGRQLWNVVISECRNRNLKSLSWETDYKVLPFYLKMGAQHLKDKPSDFVPGLMLPIVGIEL